MLRVLSLFSGIGAFEVALDEEQIGWELDHYCEIDKYACESYNMIHGTTDDDNLKDVTNIDYSKIGEIDLLTYGFPCQDISLAGQQKGFVDENGERTRSGLFFNAADIIEKTKPKFAIFENVKNLTSKKFKKEFEIVLSTLDELGYNTYWKVLNAKDYGIPQNRERVFGISVRKDIDKGYEFPQGFELKLRLKDMLEDEVDEKYYLSKDKTDKFSKQLENKPFNLLGGEQKHQSVKKDGICTTLTSSMGTGGGYIPMVNVPDSKRLGGVFDDEKGKHQAGSVWDTNGLSPTLDTMQGEWRQPCIVEPKVKELGFIKKSTNGKKHQSNTVYDSNGLARTLTACDYKSPMMCSVEESHINIPENTKKGYKEAYEGDGVYINRPHQKRGVVQHGMIQTLKTGQDVGVVVRGCDMRPKDRDYKRKGKECEEQLEVRQDELSNTLLTAHQHNLCQIENSTSLCIRKLTPRECWRLMGFKDRYFDRVQGVSNTQLYKQAGNSIVVDVLRAIFRELKKQYPMYFADLWEEDDL